MNNYHDQSENEPIECKRCFTPLLPEDLECGMCGSCQYIESANADHITENK